METKRGIGIETLVDGNPATDETVDVSSSGGVGAGAGAGSGESATGPAGALEPGPDRGGAIGRFVILGVLGSGGMGLV